MDNALAYRNKLANRRIRWAILLAVIWCSMEFYVDFVGWVDFTIFLGVIGAIAYPKNIARRIALQAARDRELFAAAADEKRNIK